MNIKIYTFDDEVNTLTNILEEHQIEYRLLKEKTKPLQCNPYLVEYINVNLDMIQRQRIIQVEKTEELFTSHFIIV